MGETTVTRAQPARDEAIRAMTEAWQESQRADKWRDYDDCTNGLLDALVAAATPCDECRGKGSFLIAAHGPSGIMHSDDPCLVCGGSGRGLPLLVALAIEAGQLQRHEKWPESVFRVVRSTTDGS